jgi:hypothetical protein
LTFSIERNSRFLLNYRRSRVFREDEEEGADAVAEAGVDTRTSSIGIFALNTTSK